MNINTANNQRDSDGEEFEFNHFLVHVLII